MIRLAVLILVTTTALPGASDELRPPTEAEIAAVPCNEAGWPDQKYIVYAGVLGSGNNTQSHNVAYGVAKQGWTQYVDKQIQPLLDGDNPPLRILIHCVGPTWPRVKDGEVVLNKEGRSER